MAGGIFEFRVNFEQFEYKWGGHKKSHSSFPMSENKMGHSGRCTNDTSKAPNEAKDILDKLLLPIGASLEF